MLKIKNITAKNFLSTGNQTQAINFTNNDLILVLGENLDQGGDDSGSRNGTGKTVMLNALSYALYGQALTNIKRNNLINNINGKNMLVTLTFEKNGVEYRIERGRSPNVLRFFINNQEQELVDESQGDSRKTQETMNDLIGMSHDMFKHIVALNTYTEPFLSMRVSDQRNIIEQLLGITILTEKAEKLKVAIKQTKDDIQEETIGIKAIQSSNEKINTTISNLEKNQKMWTIKNKEEVNKLRLNIQKLEELDVEKELEYHKLIDEWDKKTSEMNSLAKEHKSLSSALGSHNKLLFKINKELEDLSSKKCYTCGQGLHSEQHSSIVEKKEAEKSQTDALIEDCQAKISEIESQLLEFGEIGSKPATFYKNIHDAYDHKSNVDKLKNNLERAQNEMDPYQTQIDELKSSAIQEVNWDVVNERSSYKDHQEFLLKLLTNKDSFIRKKIIDQNLNYLNSRLTYYLEKLGLSHQVMFKNDLSVDITQLGKDLDFDNLSRGERNRVILGLSFSFRDVWENLYGSINLLFIDELADSGMDPAGVEHTLSLLKKMTRERNKTVYLISHKEDLASRVSNILKVTKENGFTSYSDEAI
jgi:DNA repair exonuclease SbcCD ATPase subunit